MNTSIFKQIQNDNTAYWLGFLAADGSLFEKKYKLEIGLSTKDREHLEKFKKFINTENSILDRQNHCSTNNKYYPSSYLTIQSKEIYDNLNQYGIIPNKSRQNINFLSYIPDKYKLSFIFGLFDGDGWFTCTEKSQGFGFCGNESVIKSIHQFLHFYFPHWQSTEKVLNYRNSKITYYFNITTKSQVKEFCQIYLNSINKCDLLERKQQKAKDLINIIRIKQAKLKKRINYNNNNNNNNKTYILIPKFLKTCPICKIEFLTKNNNVIYCSQECAHKAQYRCEHPTKENLYQELKENKGNFCAVARNYNVSDNTIRKWCKFYDLPFHTYDYKENLIQTTRGAKKVAQINLKTGEIIAIFNSMKEAAELVFNDGRKNKLISDVCHGRQKSSGGYGWKILEK